MLAGDIFNQEFRKIGADWVKRPITLTLAGVQSQSIDLNQPDRKDALLDDVRRLVNLREALAEEEARRSEKRLEMARRYAAGPLVERVLVPDNEFESWLESESQFWV